MIGGGISNAASYVIQKLSYSKEGLYFDELIENI